MTEIAIHQIIHEIKDLPTLPAVVMELLNHVDSDEIDINTIAQKVSQDLALTAKCLRYANSSYYSTMVKVATIPQAITILGLSSFKQVVMTAALTGCFPENNCQGFSHQQFWQHANAVAIVAKILARRLNINPDLASTAGLLHDIGVLVLVYCYPKEYEDVILYRHLHQVSLLEAERRVLAIDHSAVGKALAEQWQFPETMCKAIASHHAPDKTGAGFLATIIHAADGIAHALGVTTFVDQNPPEVTALAWESLDLDAEVLAQVYEEAQRLIKKLND